MTDWLSVVERGLKAMRYGIFQASDTVADVLDGLCRAPEDSAAGSPQNAAVVAPSPKQGSNSPPRDSAIPPAPSGGTPTHELLRDSAQHLQYYVREFEQSLTAQINARGFIHKLRERADVLDPPSK